MIFELARIYLPGERETLPFWQQALHEMCSEDFKVLRSFERQSEREFLVDLRAFFFEKGALVLHATRDSAAFPEVTADRIRTLLKGVPLLHQEVLFLKLAGYSDDTLEKIFRITPAVAQKSLERLNPEYSEALGKQQDMSLQPAAWLRLHRELRAARTEACPPLRQFIRIQDGQVGWNEKEPAERHLSECLHCLEAWTALREISFWRSAAESTPAPDIEKLLSNLPVKRETQVSRSLLSRILKKRS